MLPDLDYTGIGIRIVDQSGYSFQLKEMQLRENKFIENFYSRMTKRTFFFFGVYAVISLVLLWVLNKLSLRKMSYSILLKLQYFYMRIGNTCYKFIKKIPRGIVEYATTFLWLFLIIYFNLSSNKLLPNHSDRQRAILCSILIFVIALLSIRKKLKPVKWNDFLVKTFFAFSIMAIISDIIIKKQLMFQGFILIFIFGFLIFVWNNMDSPIELIKCYINAIHIYFVIITIFCLVCRPDNYTRYMGAFTHPVTFGVYASIIASVALVCLEQSIYDKKLNIRIFFYSLEFIISFIFVWKSQTRSALLPVVASICLVLAKHLVRWKRERIKKRFIQNVMICVLLSIPVLCVVEVSLNYIPQWLNTQIVFENDKYQSEDDAYMGGRGFVVQAAGENRKRTVRVLEKIKSGSLEHFTSGRNLYWKAYLRNMNLLGHFNYAEVMGRNQNAHSALFMVPYRYGVFSIVPYIIILFYAVIYGVNYYCDNLQIRNTTYTLFPIALILVFISTALFDVTEYLYSGLTWVGFYWVIGLFFTNRKDE